MERCHLHRHFHLSSFIPSSSFPGTTEEGPCADCSQPLWGPSDLSILSMNSC